MRWAVAASDSADAIVALRQAQRSSKAPWSGYYALLAGYAERCHRAALAADAEPDAARRQRLATEYEVARLLLTTKARDWFPENGRPT